MKHPQAARIAKHIRAIDAHSKACSIVAERLLSGREQNATDDVLDFSANPTAEIIIDPKQCDFQIYSFRSWQKANYYQSRIDTRWEVPK